MVCSIDGRVVGELRIPKGSGSSVKHKLKATFDHFPPILVGASVRLELRTKESVASGMGNFTFDLPGSVDLKFAAAQAPVRATQASPGAGSEARSALPGVGPSTRDSRGYELEPWLCELPPATAVLQLKKAPAVLNHRV